MRENARLLFFTHCSTVVVFNNHLKQFHRTTNVLGNDVLQSTMCKGCGWMDAWLDGWIIRWNGQTDGLADRCDGQIDGRTDGWMDGWMKVRTDK